MTFLCPRLEQIRSARAAARLLAVFCIFAAGQFSVSVGAQSVLRRSDPWHDMPIAVLQGLDKITARVSTFAVKMDEPSRYGTLNIVVRACRKRPPTETPESAAFMEIKDQNPGERPISLFNGWMFASSPALSALEHPVYDVWVLDCKSPSTKPQSSGSE